MTNLSFKWEPAVWTGLAIAVIDLLIAFAVPISPDQKTTILGLVDAVIAIVGSFIIRSQVTPMVKAEALGITP